MPKMKTHKSASKRFKATASGKLKRKCANRSHLNTHMSTKRKRRLDTQVIVGEAALDKLALELPYPKYIR